MPTPLQDLIENMRDGFVLLQPDGVSRYANLAAKSVLGDDLRKLRDVAALRSAMDAFTQKRLALPSPLQLDFGAHRPPVAADLIHAPVGAGVALLVHAPKDATTPPSLSNVLDLFRSELLNPVKSLVAALPPEVEGTRQDPIARQWMDVARELEKLIDFAAAFGEERPATSDRILLKDLVTEVWRDLSAFADARAIEVSMTGFGSELPPVYGNRDWLKRAVMELLDNAIRHSTTRPQAGTGQKAQIEVNARQLGPHMVITIRNAGLGQLPKVMDRVFLPFNNAGGSRKGQPRGLSIGLPLVHKLLELHGGRVRIGVDDLDNTELVIELPTGAPQQNTEKLNLEQAKRYAEDIGKLMARRKKMPSAKAAVTPST